MLSSITPLGERGKGNRYVVTAAAHVVGGLVGGALLGLAAAGVGAVARALGLGATGALAAVGVAALGAGLVDLAARDRPRLSPWRRQVNEQWLDEFRGWVYGAGFGVQLGLGLATIVTSATTYAAIASMALQPSVTSAVAVGASFGLVRGAIVLVAARVDRPARLVELHRTLAAWARPAATATGVAAAALGAVTLGLVATGAVA